MRSHPDGSRKDMGRNEGVKPTPAPFSVRMRHVILCAILYVPCVVFSAVGQESGTASYSDALVDIDSFLSEGLEVEASGSAGVATGPGDTSTPDALSGEVATASAQPDKPAGLEGWMPLPLLSPTPRAPVVEIGKTVKPAGEGTLEVVVTTGTRSFAGS